ncbi:MAG: 2-amino-4-hydroxy-6-hydroxymethyldihydropteridine diphosphokinase, partial [Mailhella sp.]|nr:2-amino-4-hydroxy-6-hydroxymethyldihydropteridine diphosphokinase [Mailhella sp.]
MLDAFISLGSNAADAESRRAAARKVLEGYAPGRIAALSSVYRTEPQGYKDQPWFANQVLRLECASGTAPEDLLRYLL